MAVFLVVIDEPSEEIKSRIKEHYPDCYAYHADTHLFLVRAEKTTTGQICENLGIGNDGTGVSGAVFRMNSAYAGYTKGDLWEWLGDE